jgi:hypothetical protein
VAQLFPIPSGAADAHAASGPPAAPASASIGFEPLLRSSFAGLDDNHTAIPPDTQGAVGPEHLVVALNSEVAIQDRQGRLLSRTSLSNFWSRLGVGVVFDPRVAYDPHSGRWMIVTMADPRSDASALLVGMSATPDPLQAWDLRKIPFDSTHAAWADYPNAGFNRRWLAVSVNVYGVVSNQFVRAELFVFDKDGLGAGAPLRLWRFEDPGHFTVVPAACLDPATDDLACAAEHGTRSLRLSRVCMIAGEPTYITNAAVTAEVSAWRFTATLTNGAPMANFLPQPGGVGGIHANDSRLQACVVRNGSIWCAHHIFLTDGTNVNRTAVQWWQLRTNGAIVQHGRIDDPTARVHHAYPSLAVNRSNDVLIGYSSFSASRPASAAYAFRCAADAPGALRAGVVFKQGLASYVRLKSSGRNSWGDYSSALVDPLNDMDLWTLQQYADAQDAAGDRWGTWWAHVGFQPVEPPRIVAWPASQAVAAFGEPIMLTVSAQGTEPLAYQWRLNDRDLPGATNATLDLPAVDLAQLGRYAVRVNNAAGYALSPAAELYAVPPRLDAWTSSQKVASGQAVTLTVQSTGTGPLFYRWDREGEPIPGATNASLSLADFQPAMAGAYAVVVSNAVGQAQSPPIVIDWLAVPAPRLNAAGFQADGTFQFYLDQPPGARIELQSSADLVRWRSYYTLERPEEMLLLQIRPPTNTSQLFFRAVQLGP